MRVADKFHGILLACLLVTSLLTGCSLYRPDLRQGNSIDQEDLDKLKPGMTKHEVQQTIGSPAMTPFLKLNQWNYTYAYVDGNHRDQPLKFKTITLIFADDKLQAYASRYWHPANLPQVK